MTEKVIVTDKSKKQAEAKAARAIYKKASNEKITEHVTKTSEGSIKTKYIKESIYKDGSTKRKLVALKKDNKFIFDLRDPKDK